MNKYYQFTDCRKKNAKEEKITCKRLSLTNTKYSWLKNLTYGPNKKENFLTNIWLSIFAINARSFLNPHWVIEQINSIQAFQFSSYENLLLSQLKNPGLLSYFNAYRTTEQSLNENLARELLELYTVGEGNFSEEDVINTALVLTGLKLNKDNRVIQSQKLHFKGETKILGKRTFFNLNSLINWLAQQPATAENVVKRFGNFLIGDHINSQDIEDVVKAFKSNNLELKSLYESFKKNERYIYCKKYGSRLLDPSSLVAKTISLIGSQHENNFKIGVKILTQMGQKFLEPPNPEGWPFGERWLTSSRIFYRRKGLKMLIADEEIWDTRNLSKILKSDLVPFAPLNINLPAPPTRENIAILITDPAWNFSKPIDLNF